MIGNGKINPQQSHDRGDQPFALAQSQSKSTLAFNVLFVLTFFASLAVVMVRFASGERTSM
jgi:hypothetical protein